MDDKKKYSSGLIILLALNFLVRIPFLNMPLYGDELNYYEGVWAIYENGLNPFVEYWSYKPPLLFEITAILFKIFGPSRVWGRLVITVFSCLSLYFTFLLGKELFNKKVGFWSAVILFFFPLFMAQSFLFQAAVPLTALTLACLYYYFSNRKWWYLLAGSLLVLTKEPAVIIIFFLTVYNFFTKLKNKEGLRKLINETIYLKVPVIFFIGWMLINKATLGWFLWPYNLSFFGNNPPNNRVSISKMTNYVFKEYFLWFIFSLLISTFVFSFSWKKLKEDFLRNQIYFFAGLFVFYLLFFQLGPFHPRYFLFLYPLAFIAYTWLVTIIFRKNNNLILILILGVCCNFSLISMKNYFLSYVLPSYGGERDLTLIRQVKVYRKAVDFVVDNYSDSVLVGQWPMNIYFEIPFNGYVNEKMKVIGCEELKKTKQNLLKCNRNILLILSYKDPIPYTCQETNQFKTIKIIKIGRLNGVKILKLTK